MLLMIKNSILKLMFVLILANRKFFSKYQDLHTLFSTWQISIAITNISKLEPSILWAMKLVFQSQNSSYLAKFDCIIWTCIDQTR